MSVSIVIPTFERANLLRRLLQSIQAQTYSEYEIIVVDDHSANYDDYVALIDQYSCVFSELTFLRNETNRGAPHSRNRGIHKAKYSLVALVDDDDEWLPQKLERQVEVFDCSPDHVGLVYTWTDIVQREQRVPFYQSAIQGNCLSEILHDCFIPSPSVMARKKALLDVKCFDERLPSCQDWDLWTRILARGYEVRVVPEVLTLYHKQESDSIGTSPHARSGYMMYYRKHFWKLLRFGEFRHLIRYSRLVTEL